MSSNLRTFTIKIPASIAAGDETGLLPYLPEKMTLVDAQLFIGTIACAGAGAAASFDLLKYVVDTETSLLRTAPTLHKTNSDQKFALALALAASTINCEEGAEIRAKLTTAGGDTATASAVYVLLTFARPLKP